MILYLAGSIQPTMYERIANRACANHFLFSFADTEARKCAEHFCTQPQRRIFIDSGAYSVWTKGKKVDLGEYITFCKRIMGMAKCPVVFAALDVIPGKKEDAGIPTEGEKERACDEGWANYQTMKQEGIPCLMTFHQFEHRDWLTRIADDSDYLAVAPRKRGVSADDKFKWLEQVFRCIQPLDTSNGAPRLRKKIHGLGVSSVDWMKRLPFFSVDNTDWVKAGKHTLFRHSVGEGGSRSMNFEQWERHASDLGLDRLASEYGVPTEDFLTKMLGYPFPGEKPDPNATSGRYWLMFMAMIPDVETEYRVTKHWRDKGLILPPYPSPLMTAMEAAARRLGLTF